MPALEADALATGLADPSMDAVMLFGVIPFPTLPLGPRLPEMHRILRPRGFLPVWLFPSELWVPQSIARSGLFEQVSKRNGAYNDRRCEARI